MNRIYGPGIMMEKRQYCDTNRQKFEISSLGPIIWPVDVQVALLKGIYILSDVSSVFL